MGGGGPPLGNFSHIIPFFSLITTLILTENALGDELTTGIKTKLQIFGESKREQIFPDLKSPPS